jgi:predicted DNA-binding transcriptional regulator AlpA
MSERLHAEVMTRQQTAKYCGISVSKLDHDKAEGTGPSFIKIGRSVRYRRADVEAWLAAHIVGGGK